MAAPRALVFAGVFLLVFGSYGGWHFIRSLEPLTWKPAPCTVIRFTPTDNPDSDRPFSAEVEFRFEADDSWHHGRNLGIPGWKEAGNQLHQMLRFEARPESTCYLPAGKPEHAVLLRPQPKWGGLLFVGFALSVGWILYQVNHNRHEVTGTMSRKLMPVLALFFGTPGLVLLFDVSIPVWRESVQVRSWKKTPAIIIWSEIRTQSSGGRTRSTNYKADLCYEYKAVGRNWRQNRVSPGGLQGGGSSPAKELVRNHRPGTRITCYVNPDRPERAIMIPNPGWAILWTLFPLPFLAIAAMLVRSWFQPD